MNDTYKELIRFKYEANLLYTETLLKEHHITFESKHDTPFRLFVKPEEYEKASTLINNLELDEREVSEESEAYIAGYEEWAEKRFVNGYFTGGTIPRWMFEKKYALWFGPVNIITGLFILYTLSTTSFDVGKAVPFFFCLVYIICGVLLTVRGFKK